MALLGYIGFDQYGQTYKLTDSKHPRKQLLEKLGKTSAVKVYRDLKSGGSHQVGYKVGGLWVDIYEVHSWDTPIFNWGGSANDTN